MRLHCKFTVKQTPLSQDLAILYCPLSRTEGWFSWLMLFSYLLLAILTPVILNNFPFSLHVHGTESPLYNYIWKIHLFRTWWSQRGCGTPRGSWVTWWLLHQDHGQHSQEAICHYVRKKLFQFQLTEQAWIV